MKRKGPSPAVLSNELFQLKKQIDQLQFRVVRQQRQGDPQLARTQARLEGLRRTHQWLKRLHMALHPLNPAHQPLKQAPSSPKAVRAAAPEAESSVTVVDNTSAPQTLSVRS
jgi:hypothetical protein